MLQQDWSVLLATGIDTGAACSQDWLNHHFGENGTASHIPAYLKVPIRGNICHWAAVNNQKYQTQETTR